MMIPTTMSLRPMTTSHSFMTQVDNSTIRIDVARREMTITTFLYFFSFFTDECRENQHGVPEKPQFRSGRVARGPPLVIHYFLCYTGFGSLSQMHSPEYQIQSRRKEKAAGSLTDEQRCGYTQTNGIWVLMKEHSWFESGKTKRGKGYGEFFMIAILLYRIKLPTVIAEWK